MTHPEPLTLAVGRRVAQRRDAAGWSQSKLAALVAEQGLDWGRTTVAKLESGDRKSVSVQELLVLALVFDVPPVMLLADPRDGEDVPVAPGRAVDPWGALSWLVGAGGLGDGRDSAAFSDAGWYIDQAFVLGDALRTLETAARTTGTRDEDGNLTRDPEVVRQIVEKRERAALETVRAALERIDRDRAPLPVLPEAVRKRAADLGVDLPAGAA